MSSIPGDDSFNAFFVDLLDSDDGVEADYENGIDDSDLDADCELDDENAQNQDHVQNTEVENNAIASTPVEILEPVVTVEQVEAWKIEALNKLQKKINAKTKKIKSIEKMVSLWRKTAEDKDQTYKKTYEEKKKGQHELDKILKARDYAMRQEKKRQEELIKLSDEVQNFQDRIAEINANPRSVYFKVTKPSQRRIPQRTRKLTTKTFRFDPNFDNDEGDDSLSDNPEYIKYRIALEEEAEKKNQEANKGINAKVACRRCKVRSYPHISIHAFESICSILIVHILEFILTWPLIQFRKTACVVPKGSNRCEECRDQNKKCRFVHPLFPNWSIPTGYLDRLDEEYKLVKAKLEEYEKDSYYSTGPNNPLSGISGYGPRSPRIAKQNYYLMKRGKTPIYGLSAPNKRKCKYPSSYLF